MVKIQLFLFLMIFSSFAGFAQIGDNIHKLEYSIDTPVPYGTGINLVPNAEGEYTIPTTDLAPGVHTLILRAQKNDGTWSVTSKKQFFIGEEKAQKPVEVEYFITSSEGLVGDVVRLPVDTELNEYSFMAAAGALVDGNNYQICTQVINSAGKRSFLERVDFTYVENQAPQLLENNLDVVLKANEPQEFILDALLEDDNIVNGDILNFEVVNDVIGENLDWLVSLTSDNRIVLSASDVDQGKTGSFSLIATDSFGETVSLPVSFTVDVTTDIKRSYVGAIKYTAVPNPTNGWTRIRGNHSVHQNVLIQVFDFKGSLVIDENVASFSSTNGFDIDLSGFQAGVYIVKVVSVDYVETLKLLKQ